MKADDSCFDVVEVPVLYEYPGELNRRIRWESCSTRAVTEEEKQKLPALAAAGIADIVKLAKGQMKNILLPKFIPAMIPVGRMGRVEDTFVLEDPIGNRIVLRDRGENGEDHRTTQKLLHLPGVIPSGSAVFGLVFYDAADRRICLHPYSLVTPDAVIRLLY